MRRKTGHLQSHPIPSLAMIKREPKDKRKFYCVIITKLVFHQKMTIVIIVIMNNIWLQIPGPGIRMVDYAWDVDGVLRWEISGHHSHVPDDDDDNWDDDDDDVGDLSPPYRHPWLWWRWIIVDNDYEDNYDYDDDDGDHDDNWDEKIEHFKKKKKIAKKHLSEGGE